MSFDMTEMRDDASSVVDNFDPDSRSIHEGEFDLEAWPNGIIKTVSVEVVEEDNLDYQPRGLHSHTPSSNSLGVGSNRGGGMIGHSAKGSEVSIEHDWETMLRVGPI